MQLDNQFIVHYCAISGEGNSESLSDRRSLSLSITIQKVTIAIRDRSQGGES
jgi:hypothetical protein